MSWRLNQINIGPPYRVALVGPYNLPQVQDGRGTVAVSHDGAVFCASVADAQAVCDAANAGELRKA